MRVSFVSLILPVLALQLRVAHGACGDSGAALFEGDGNALRAAVSCFLLETNCDTSALLTAMGIDQSVPGATTDVAGVGNFYGANITNWCTGNVLNFNSVFQGLAVCCIQLMCLLA